MLPPVLEVCPYAGNLVKSPPLTCALHATHTCVRQHCRRRIATRQLPSGRRLALFATSHFSIGPRGLLFNSFSILLRPVTSCSDLRWGWSKHESCSSPRDERSEYNIDPCWSCLHKIASSRGSHFPVNRVWFSA